MVSSVAYPIIVMLLTPEKDGGYFLNVQKMQIFAPILTEKFAIKTKL